MIHRSNYKIDGHLLIHSGFTQHEGGQGGANDLWRRARAEFEPRIAVHRLRWNADFGAMADSIKRDSVPHPWIVVAAYSWGAGNGLLKLADALAGHGLGIHAAVLSDPIYHSFFFSMRWLAVSRLQPQIPLPFNVLRVEWFNQTLDDWLWSPGLVSQRYPERIAPPVTLPYKHKGMDNAPEWHDKVMDVTREVCL